ncbi:MOSC domain-containing protein [Advenella mimigardefordensis]|uniref:MOSC domain-containing protein n=1 Tax=Advenella mimigardefordensis (strain DSM 17166 / LMG 22922 / DPN7) TaxID=1247726 RepID=W0PHE0_ADVMD|nr:MOSC domain-containing protein [Advenella mimigardefordensis]AHG65936.1 MOSC domain-containing protein [Advenella mimigardefordensis DPN7]
MTTSHNGRVRTVAKDDSHRFSKTITSEIYMVAGLGVQGDAHSGVTVQHRSRVAVDPKQPNLRQVHLIQAELFDELNSHGFNVAPADLGENISTEGIDLLSLPRNTLLNIGSDVLLQVTGLRNPCVQIDRFQTGLLKAVLHRQPDGGLVRKAGIMTVVITGGVVRAGDPIAVQLPALPHLPLDRV